jgi:hypothetical protein
MASRNYERRRPATQRDLRNPEHVEAAGLSYDGATGVVTCTACRKEWKAFEVTRSARGIRATLRPRAWKCDNPRCPASKRPGWTSVNVTPNTAELIDRLIELVTAQGGGRGIDRHFAVRRAVKAMIDQLEKAAPGSDVNLTGERHPL